MCSEIASGRLRPGRVSPWARRTWRRLLGARSGHRPTQRRQVDVLPAAVARFSSSSGGAAVSKQREDVEHASALKARDPPNPPKSMSNRRLEWANPSCQPADASRALPSRRPRSAGSDPVLEPCFSGCGPAACALRRRNVTTGNIIFSPPRRFSPRRHFSPRQRFCRARCCADREGLAAPLGRCRRPGPRPFSTRRW